MHLSGIYFLLCASLTTRAADIPQQFTQDPCASKSTCHDCIRTPSCAWCADTTFRTNKRCFQPSHAESPLDQCNPDLIYNPDNAVHILENTELSTRADLRRGGIGSFQAGYEAGYNGSSYYGSRGSQYSGSGAGVTQIKPQRLSLKLRARQTYSIRMYYTQAEDSPLDLYYLMDLSKSMQDDKDKLSALGNHLAETMKKMTSKFTLGFGSFVDKVVMPYVSTIPENLISPCPGCKAPYGFRNMMRLSSDTWQFSRMVQEASVSGNLDAPEGGFDAIMQAAVCGNKIGWREKVRHLLVFSTDSSFHYAGDGKLGGIVKPNDGLCHLDNRGYYDMSSHQDYPSISQINKFVKDNFINVIFAVTADKIGIYEQLTKHIEGSSCGILSNDSSNVVDLIKEQYEAISSTVEMKHNASSDVSVRFFSKCLHPDGKEIETNKCNEIKIGSVVEFRIELQVLECPKKPRDWHQIIQIRPVGINENLMIDLTMLCDCPCEHSSDASFLENAPECSSKGTFMCGICQCHPNAYGPHCECSDSQAGSANVSTSNCINNQTGQECSGKGSCVCGSCICDPRNNPLELIYGTTCECDNFSCERHNGIICNGKGTCGCHGICTCDEGWTGPDCACKTSIAGCISPTGNQTQICSDHGECECGACKCRKIDDKRSYYGLFCQHDPTDTVDKCKELAPCVLCKQYNVGPFYNSTNKKCLSNEICGFEIIEAEVIEENVANNEIKCVEHYEDCRYDFVYYYNNASKLEIRALKELQCPPVVFFLGIVIGVIAAVVLIGLAVLLLWKLWTTIHDRREFAKFEKEAMMARWDTGENPIYKQATSTFKNPTYAGKS